jgi:hypothetical protein
VAVVTDPRLVALGERAFAIMREHFDDDNQIQVSTSTDDLGGDPIFVVRVSADLDGERVSYVRYLSPALGLLDSHDGRDYVAGLIVYELQKVCIEYLEEEKKVLLVERDRRRRGKA